METATFILAVIGTGIAIPGLIVAIMAYRKQAASTHAEDTRQLSIRVNSTREGTKQLAQLMFVNEGRRPINIIGWYCSTPTVAHRGGKLHKSPYYKNELPILLNEHESGELLVSFDEIDWQHLSTIGLLDVTNNLWPAPQSVVSRFIETAMRYRPGGPQLIPGIPLKPESSDASKSD